MDAHAGGQVGEQPERPRPGHAGPGLAIALVVAMAAGVTALGLTGAFPGGPLPGDALGRRPKVTIDHPLATGPTSGHVYRLVPPALTAADARRIFAAVGDTSRVHASKDDFFTERGPGDVSKSSIGWYVDTYPVPGDPATAKRPAGAPPAPDEALAAAQRTLTALGVPIQHVRVHGADARTGTRTVDIDRVVDGRALALLGWTVQVGPGGRVEAVSGYLTDLVDEGRVTTKASTDVARGLADPSRTAVALPAAERFSPEAVTFATDAIQYEDVPDRATKYVLLDSDSCSLLHFPDPRIPGKSGNISSGEVRVCYFATPQAVRVRSSRPTFGLLVEDHGGALLVPSYRFRIEVRPHVPHKSAMAAVTVVALDPATLTRVERAKR